MKKMKRFVSALLSAAFVFATIGTTFAASVSETPTIKNVIYMIPDGGAMAPFFLAEAVKGEDMYLKEYLVGAETTYSASDAVTDSAAGGTALSSGYKTNNGYIGIDPSKRPHANILEACQDAGKKTGMVVTVEWTNATPAAFSAHDVSRYNMTTMSEQIVNQGIDVVFGNTHSAFSTSNWFKDSALEERGYKIISNPDEVDSIEKGDRVWGKLADGAVDLATLTGKTIEALDCDEEGFFLMVEGSAIDLGGHANDATYMVDEYLEFDAACEVAIEYAKERNDTAVIIAPDHDTGGLSYDYSNIDKIVSDIKNDINTSLISWETTGHTNRNGGVFMYLPEGISYPSGIEPTKAEQVKTEFFNAYGNFSASYPAAATNVIDNTDIAEFVASLVNVDFDAVSEKLFVDVTEEGTYDQVSEVFSFTNQNIQVKRNESCATINGKTVSLDGEVAVYVEGRFYVPARLLTYFGEPTSKEVYSEIYSLDFDDLATGTFANDTSDFAAKYTNAKLLSSSGDWKYSVEEHENASGDKYIYLENDSEAGGATAIQINLPYSLGENTGKYKLSYNIRFDHAYANGPYFRVKTFHYSPSGIDNWGPALQTIYPSDGNIKATYSTATSVENSWFAEAKDTEAAITLSQKAWHRAEAIIDTSNSKIDFYYDGNYVGSQKGTTYLSLLNSAKYMQLYLFEGFQVWSGVFLDDVSISKLISATAEIDLGTVTISEDKKEIKIYADRYSKTKFASVVNNKTGESIPMSISAMAGGVKLTLSEALEENSEYMFVLDGAYGTACCKITLGNVAEDTEQDKWADLLAYDFTEGSIPSAFTTTNATIESGALKLSGTKATAELALANAGTEDSENVSIAGNSGVYELSYDINIKREVVDGKSRAPYFDFCTKNYKDNISAIALTVNQWDGTLRAPTQSYNYWDYCQNMMALSGDTWYNIRMVMNTVDGTIEYYNGDTFLYKRDKVNWWSGNVSSDITKGIDSFVFNASNNPIPGDVTVYLDNFRLKKKEEAKEEKVEVFRYDFAEGSIPSSFTTTNATIESGALKLSGTKATAELALANAGTGGVENVSIAGNSGVYELSYDINIKREVVDGKNRAPFFTFSTKNHNDNISAIALTVNQWDGNLCTPKQSYNYWDYYQSMMQLLGDTWYNIRMVMNTDDGTIEYYNGNTFLYKRDKVNWWDGNESSDITEGIDSFVFNAANNPIPGDVTVYLDNITLSKAIINGTGFTVTDVFDNELYALKSYDRYIKEINITTDGVPTKMDLSGITLKKNGNTVNVKAAYDATKKVTVAKAYEVLGNGEYILSAFGDTYAFTISASDKPEILDFYLTDENGGNLVVNDIVTVNATIKSNMKDAMVLVAVYNNNALTDLVYEPVSKTKSIESISKHVTIKDAENVRVKAFVLEDLKSIKPMNIAPITLGN